MEDDPGLARLFKRRLERVGNRVDIAPDGDTGLSQYSSNQYDLVVLDQKLPGKSGLEVLKILSQGARMPPTIMLTGAGDETIAVEAMKLGSSDYIIKDLHTRYLDLMPSVIEHVLKHHAVHEERRRAEEELHRAHAELERRVEMRTAELLITNEKLWNQITERRQAEESLRKSEEWMRLIIESSPVGIHIVRDGRYRYVNPAFVRMFGYESTDEVVGIPFESVYEPEHHDLVSSMERAVAHGGEMSRRFEARAVHKGGRSFDVSVWQAPVKFGPDLSTLGFVIDVSEEKQLRAQLLHVQKMEAIGTLAGGIAHDFNNILSVINGYVELALTQVAKNSELYSDLGRVRSAGDRASDLVRQILALSRKDDEEKKPTLVAPIIKETLRFVRASIPPSVEIRQLIQPDERAIMAVPTQIHQIFMNLCTNAAHAMRESGGSLYVLFEWVTLGTNASSRHPDARPGPYCRLTVRDTGHGMPPDVMERIFEPYFTTKAQGEGTGFGLAIVHGIVANHGGFITVESKPGAGSTFQVFLPAIQQEAPRISSPDEECPRGSESILCVDDEQHIACIMDGMLSRLGYRVVSCTDSEKALGIFCADPRAFDLVITAMSMPKLTGAQLVDEILSVRPDIPVIFCSGGTDVPIGQPAEPDGVRELIAKPFRKNELAATVRRVLDMRQAPTEEPQPE